MDLFRRSAALSYEMAYERFLDRLPELPREWADSCTSDDHVLNLTAEEMCLMIEELNEVVRRWQIKAGMHGDDELGVEPVALISYRLSGGFVRNRRTLHMDPLGDLNSVDGTGKTSETRHGRNSEIILAIRRVRFLVYRRYGVGGRSGAARTGDQFARICGVRLHRRRRLARNVVDDRATGCERIRRYLRRQA